MAHSLLRSFDKQLYDSIMILNKVEKELELLWRSKEDVLVEYGAAPDGIYIIVTGTARVLDADGVQIDQIGAGELFGEIAYLAGTARRHATVVANTDMILRKMDGKHLRKFPELQHLFPPIALHRLVNEG